ncbi:LLM class flavin-dependent oxidoreductase [Rhodococcus triatomae]|uniref:Alkanesulfonate monooxygenase n=1 Tax=Rhodococcus triatomae TaxID=300028 RepID=A0A1G7ZLU3_9NOCA|nr:LLM class flavin-dependent oxidoreductase [Rhodococcus triatomae]QNG18007.1 LLM class flavin-dependent oxidoreductase [Rhodococcus triatomae]QNG22324.1 LLM class flavin-dependent oxidoreductase [Rhodococcus triatomae]SDH09644.1 alkanesulfonate monooxygenase [Rhodococcus triatomae]
MDHPDILWYIGANDGAVPWDPRHRDTPSFEALRHQARTLDRLGFFGALTTAREAVALVGDTERLRFVVPEYPGVKPPALMAEQAQVFDHYSGGRLIFNQVNGADPVLARYGLFHPKDERYARSVEYWTQVRKLYLDEADAFTGDHFEYGPRYKPEIPGPRQPGGVPIWGTGASPAGIDHAAEVLDAYLTFMGPVDEMSTLFTKVRKAAAETGRSMRFGVLASVIVRETEDEAWERFEWQLANTSPESVLATADRNLVSFGFDPLEALTSPDAQVRARIEALRSGRLPTRADLEFAPNMAAGLTTWTAAEPPFDVAGKGTGTYLVGSADNVAARMQEMQDALGIDIWILSGWPLAAEAENTARLLFPRLGVR